MQAFFVDARAMAVVDLVRDPLQPSRVVDNALKLRAPAQQQRLRSAPLKMPVGRLDGAVLVGRSAIVTTGMHPAMSAQRLVAGGEIRFGLRSQILESRREAIGTMLLGATP